MNNICKLPEDLIGNILKWLTQSDFLSFESSYRGALISPLRDLDATWFAKWFPNSLVNCCFLDWLKIRGFVLDEFHCSNGLLNRHFTALPHSMSKLHVSGLWRSNGTLLRSFFHSSSSFKCSCLRSIVLKGFQESDLDANEIKAIVRSIALSSGNLTSCDFSDSSIGKDVVMLLCRKNSYLKRLILWDGSYLGNDENDTFYITSIIETCLHLTDLQIPLRTRVVHGDKIWAAIAQFGSNYTTLDMSRQYLHTTALAPNVTSINSVLLRCSFLTNLNLAYCGALDDDLLHTISNLSLIVLDISGAVAVSSTGLDELFAACKTIERLTMPSLDPDKVGRCTYVKAPLLLPKLYYFSFYVELYAASDPQCFFSDVFEQFCNVKYANFHKCIIEKCMSTIKNNNLRWKTGGLHMVFWEVPNEIQFCDKETLLELNGLNACMGPNWCHFNVCRKLSSIVCNALHPFDRMFLDHLLEIIYNNINLREIVVDKYQHAEYSGKAIVLTIADRCCKMESISLTYTDVDDDCVGILTTKCKRLTSISFCGCKLLTDVGLNHMLSNLESLNMLCVEHTSVTHLKARNFNCACGVI
jgi:hypothetical protein